MCTFQPFQALLAGRLVCTNTEVKYVRPPWPEISLYESLTADISAAIKSSYEIGSVLSEVGWSTVHSVLDRCDPLLPVTYCSQESDTVCPPPHISTPLNLLKTHTGEKSYKCEHIKSQTLLNQSDTVYLFSARYPRALHKSDLLFGDFVLNHTILVRIQPILSSRYCVVFLIQEWCGEAVI